MKKRGTNNHRQENDMCTWLAREHGLFGEKQFVTVETYGADLGMMKDGVGEVNGMNHTRSCISG